MTVRSRRCEADPHPGRPSGGRPMLMNPSEFGKLIADETGKWRKVVEFAGVSAD